MLRFRLLLLFALLPVSLAAAEGPVSWGFLKFDARDFDRPFTSIAAGSYHTLALKADGTVTAWGSDDSGESTVPAGLGGVNAVGAGNSHSLALAPLPLHPTDLDGDGLANLDKLAFGLDPSVPDSALAPAPVAEDGYLTITLTKHAGATYQVQSAGTLLLGQPESFSPATTTVLIDSATTLKVRDNFLLGTPPARYMRVKVTASP